MILKKEREYLGGKMMRTSRLPSSMAALHNISWRYLEITGDNRVVYVETYSWTT